MKFTVSAFTAVALLLSHSVEANVLREHQRARAVKRLNEAIQNTELKDETRKKLEGGERLNSRERKEIKTVERNVYLSKRAAGQDEVGFRRYTSFCDGVAFLRLADCDIFSPLGFQYRRSCRVACLQAKI